MIPVPIPVIDIAPVFGPAGPARDRADAAIIEAATVHGFMTVTGLPASVPLGEDARVRMMRFFALDQDARMRLARQKYAPGNENIYRGYFPLKEGDPTYKEGVDLGPDIADPAAVAPDDPLREATPLPDEADLPGWRADIAAYHRAMSGVGAALMRAIARGLGLDEDFFEAPFRDGVSTLRIIRYPARTPEALAALAPELVLDGPQGRSSEKRYIVGTAHCDSGFVTLLNQDALGGLHARARNGDWLDVPAREDGLAVNFGQLLVRWTGGRVKATEHRVASPNRERVSVPFFYEPAVDAVIRPLPLAGAPDFEPFAYGDHVWNWMSSFIEFQGLEDKRPPRGVAA